MKKYTYILLAAGLAAGVSACSLDRIPKTQLGSGSIETEQDVNGLALGLYSQSRPVFMGDHLMWADYMGDILTETSNSGNRGGFFYRWVLQENDGDVGAVWNNVYTLISRANFLLSVADNAVANGADQGAIDQYKAEAYLWRAIATRHLAMRFCKDYEPSTAASTMGVPLVTTWDLTLLPSRGTLEETYAGIISDIESAEGLMSRAGAADAERLTVDCVAAFKAQVYLDMHNYSGAIAAVNSLVPKYPLATSKADIENMWLADKSTETIFQITLTNTEIAGGLGYYDYAGVSIVEGEEISNGAYLPEQWVLDLYDRTADWRYGVYVGEMVVSFGNTAKEAHLLTKYLGSAALRTGPNYNNYNNAKIFRMADMVLIKAEAEYAGQTGNALATLNTLRVARGLAALSGVSGNALFTEIQNERVRELIGEGGRIPDIKRWKISHARNPQTVIIDHLAAGVAHTKVINHSDDGMLMPIPLSEFNLNPNLDGQQNPGY